MLCYIEDFEHFLMYLQLITGDFLSLLNEKEYAFYCDYSFVKAF